MFTRVQIKILVGKNKESALHYISLVFFVSCVFLWLKAYLKCTHTINSMLNRIYSIYTKLYVESGISYIQEHVKHITMAVAVASEWASSQTENITTNWCVPTT